MHRNSQRFTINDSISVRIFPRESCAKCRGRINDFITEIHANIIYKHYRKNGKVNGKFYISRFFNVGPEPGKIINFTYFLWHNTSAKKLLCKTGENENKTVYSIYRVYDETGAEKLNRKNVAKLQTVLLAYKIQFSFFFREGKDMDL